MANTLLDATMIKNFIDDQQAFNRAVDTLFTSLDADKDGVLSRVELLKGFEGLLTSVEPLSPSSPATGVVENAVFEKFDGDGNGNIDRKEFQKEMRQIMMAMASGIGDSPVEMVVDEGSIFMRIIEHAKAKSNS